MKRSKYFPGFLSSKLRFFYLFHLSSYQTNRIARACVYARVFQYDICNAWFHVPEVKLELQKMNCNS